MNRSTPGVYVEEISLLPPSVAAVATAIPAFIGFTQKGPAKEVRVEQIKTLLEFEEKFGYAKPTDFTVRRDDEGAFAKLEGEVDEPPEFMLWYCLNHYFKNGGGRCYVVSVDNYDIASGDKKERLSDGVSALLKYDEPTLIVAPEAVGLGEAADHGAVNQQILEHCKEMQDRFAVLDVRRLTVAEKKAKPEKTDVGAFRDGVTAYLSYGAAYYPYLKTTLTHQYMDRSDPNPENHKPTAVKIETAGETDPDSPASVSPPGDRVTDDQTLPDDTPAPSTTDPDSPASVSPPGDRVTDDQTLPDDTPAPSTTDPGGGDSSMISLHAIRDSQTALYNRVLKELDTARVVLPPSAAMAGIYARVDRDRGVWKAPANVGVFSVVEPTVKITHEDQETLNVDPSTGKSINAIRSFAGKGTLVWGARTLAGNDNEWRYVNVRRLFIMIEESTKKASNFAVFEPNDSTTWLKVKGMIESFLYGLWEQGALQGSTPESAYFVNVGLGKTMTTQDILEGRMIVEIGIAAVRPAEFIILRFSHKLAEA